MVYKYPNILPIFYLFVVLIHLNIFVIDVAGDMRII